MVVWNFSLSALMLLVYTTAIGSNSQNSTETDENFIHQEVRYYAPESATVYLLWKTENHSQEESVLWNDETTFKDEYLCNLLIPENDTFRIRIKVPKNSTLEYYFWITKNKQGHYQDFWDIRSSGKIFADGSAPLIKTANYSKQEAVKNKSIIEKGWIILFILILIYIPAFQIQKRWFKKTKTSSLVEKVLFLGISLAVFHALARSEIININISGILHNFRLIPKIARASLQDFVFVGSLVLAFMLALYLIKNTNIKKAVFVLFLILSALATLAAFMNISAVVYFGKPFTYQWLYYSDFLGSNEAKSAFQENLSTGIILNMIFIVISFWILAEILRIFYRVLTSQKYLSFATHSLIFIVLTGLVFTSVKTKANWTKGQSENAVTAMVGSVLAANASHSFFTTDIPHDSEPFDPKKAELANTVFEFNQNQQIENILFIVLESAGAEYFDAYGGTFQLSPNLNKYASQAVIFDQMYAHAPATNRSLVSVLGSVYPYISYKSLTQESPAVDHPTISSVLSENGYRTSFFSTADLNFQNSKQFLNYRGFDIVEDYATINCAEEYHLDNPDYLQGNGKDDLCLADRFASWLEEDTTRNFFSMLWTVQGHYPYFFGKEEEDFGVSDVNFNRYLNCLKYNDKLVGEVMSVLENKGLAENTIVVIFGDHGEAFGQHQQYGHGTGIYEENLRVPLWFINPKLFSGERKTDIAGMKDLATTVFPLIGAEVPQQWQGRNLLATNAHEMFFFAPWSDYLFGYRNKNMKYIFNETRNTLEVYDVMADPGELVNLAQSIDEEQVDFARNRIAAWVQYQDRFIKKLIQTEK